MTTRQSQIAKVRDIERRLSDRYAKQFAKLKAQGVSQSEIARRYGISRQRVSQILKRARERGLTAELSQQ